MDASKNLRWYVRSGKLEEVRKLITKYGISHRQEWSNGYTLLRDAIENGKMEVAKLLLANGCNVQSKRSLTVPTKTVLHFAAGHGNLEILKTVLEKGAYVNVIDQDGITPLHEAVKRTERSRKYYETLHNTIICRIADKRDDYYENWEDFEEALKWKMGRIIVTQEEHAEFVKILHDKGADVNVTDKDGNTPLHEAVKKEDVGATVLLVEYGANVNARNKNGEMPLHIASDKGHIRNAEHLIQHGADVNSVCTNYFKKCYTPLHFAAENGYEGIADLLLNSGASVNPIGQGITPLSLAAKNAYERIVKILLDKGADINVTDEDGNTPLHDAVKMENVDTSVILVEYGANVNTRNKNCEMPLHIALEKGLIRNAEHLVKHGADVNSVWTNYSKCGYTPLHCAAEKGYERIVKILLDKGAYVNITDGNDNAPLHEAVKRSEVGTTVLLLEYGANVNAKNKNGEMPLHIASEKGHIRNAEHLLEHGAYVNSVMTNNSKNGYTALHFSAENGHDGIVDLLLNKGASVNAIAKGRTPLHSAAERGYANITENLLKDGADVNSICTANSSEGCSPLHFAVRNGHVSVVRILLAYGANIDAQDESGDTILHVAVSTAKTSMVETVLNYRPDVNNENNRLSLNLALNGLPSRHKEIVELLLQNGFNIRDEADVKAVSGSCMSSIHASALNAYHTVLGALLDQGASANSKDKNGQTPLHAAAIKGNLQVIDTLVKYGADIDSRDHCGRTALHIASSMGYPDVVKGLLHYGSDVNIADCSNKTAIDFARIGRYESRPIVRFLDDCDSYYGHHLYSFLNYVRAILEKHIIMLKIIHENLSSIMDYRNQYLADIEECKDECEILKGTFVGNTKHSFFHLLSKSDHHLAVILQDDNVSRCITPNHIRKEFPQYGSIICGHLTIAKHRRRILDEINVCVFQLFPKLNWECIQKIITYLSNGDLMNVTHACKCKPTAL